MRNICTIEKCRNHVVGRGLCRKHYMRWQRWGNPEEPDHRSMRKRSVCDAAECGKPVHSGGLCSTHHRQRQRDADPTSGPHQRNCEWCNVEFLGQRSTARFCSRLCAQRARMQKPENKRKSHNRYYLERYGITKAEADEMRVGGCDICGRTEVEGRWNNNLHIDHDHGTGKVRGVLCQNCNTGLGQFQDDPGLLQSALNYLR